MEDKVLAEILSAHADLLKRDRGKGSDYLAMFPDYQEELGPLLETAERVKKVLEPVDPSPGFCQSLHDDLLVAAYRQPDEGMPQLAPSHRKQILIGAAAVGSVVSLAGALAYVVRSRFAAKTQPASPA
jgi:hypothetical protein